MPITDNTFDAAELEAAAAANPALLETVKSSLEKLGLRKSIADETTSNVLTTLDTEWAQESGIAKEPNEKTHAYAKRIVGALKSATTPLQTKIAELETAIAAGNGNATMQAQLDQYKTKEAEWQTKEQDYGTRLFQAEVRGDVKLGRVGLKFTEGLPKSLVELAFGEAEKKIVAMAAPQTAGDQTTIVYMENGKVKLGKDNQPATAADLLQEQLKEILDTGVEGAGGGGQGGQHPPRLDAQGQVVVPDALPATVKNQGQLIDYLVGLGVKKDTDAFDKAFDKLKGALPLR
jgi:hypothetical protein